MNPLLMQSLVHGPAHTRPLLLREWLLAHGEQGSNGTGCRAHCTSCSATWGETWQAQRRRQGHDAVLAQQFVRFRAYLNRRSGPTRKATRVFSRHPDWSTLRVGLRRISVARPRSGLHKAVYLHYDDRVAVLDYRRCYFPASRRSTRLP